MENTNKTIIPDNPVPSTETSLTSESVLISKKNSYKYIVIVSIFIFLGIIISVLFQIKEENNTFETQLVVEEADMATITPTPDIDISILPGELMTTNKYINKDLGFSVTYPKYSLIYRTCDEAKVNQTNPVLMTIFEDPEANTFYISNNIYVKIKAKQIASDTFGSEYSSCEVVLNNLDLIKNGYDSYEGTDSEKLFKNNTSPALQISYRKIENDIDLQTLAQSIYKGCYIGPKEEIVNADFVSASSPLYKIKLVNQNGQLGDGVFDSASTCITNFYYYFIYNPSSQVAIISSGMQDAPFYGANGQTHPKFEFFK